MTTLTTPPPPRSAMLRHQWLEDLHARFHDPKYIGTDPLRVLYRYPSPADREIVGLTAALLAYGNVKAIVRGVEDVLHRLGPSPHDYLTRKSASEIRRDFRGFRYRVTSDSQMTALLIGVKHAVTKHGSLNATMVDASQREILGSSEWLLTQIGVFVDTLTSGSGGDSDALLHLVPHPARGSACKRLMLYLRWMVRRDAIDPGGWTGISPADLIIPLDTHVHRMSRRLGLTRRKQANLVTALEITACLRRYCPDDPLRYDFCLTRPGIMRIKQDN